VLIVSTELDEVLALADRIAVMYQGRIVAVLDQADATPEKLGLLMGGAELEGGEPPVQAQLAAAGVTGEATSAGPDLPADGGSR
jgi:simple sugar transport system ATP-binding protein